MAQLEWFEAVELIRPHVVRILTPQGSGTGFLFSRSANGSVCGIATAAHVVNQAHYWEQPIRLQSADSGQVAVLRPSDRAIILDESRDTAAIAFKSDILALPEEPPGLISTGSYLKVGTPSRIPCNLRGKPMLLYRYGEHVAAREQHVLGRWRRHQWC